MASCGGATSGGGGGVVLVPFVVSDMMMEIVYVRVCVSIDQMIDVSVSFLMCVKKYASTKKEESSVFTSQNT